MACADIYKAASHGADKSMEERKTILLREFFDNFFNSESQPFASPYDADLGFLSLTGLIKRQHYFLS